MPVPADPVVMEPLRHAAAVAAPATETADGPTLATNRRRSERIACSHAATLRSPTATDAEPGKSFEAVNLSRHGVLLIGIEPVVPGTFQVLELDRCGRADVREVRILHCRRNPDDGRYDVGVTFA